MSISRLPSGRWRAQVYNPASGKNESVAKILGRTGPDATFPTKREAKAAREQARLMLGAPRSGVTVSEFRERWLTDPLFARPKQSTIIRNAERTKKFNNRYGQLALGEIGDQVVSEWLAGGKTAHTVPALRAMWNDARSAKAGRLVDSNPWAGLGLERSTGNRYKQPPSEQVVWELIGHARRLAGQHFAAWLQVACFTGMRPGELDALRWDNVDLARGRIRVIEQYNGTTSTITPPKNGRSREAILTPPAREALLALPRLAEHCFLSLRGTHFTKSSRAYHWKAIRAAAGWDGSPYLTTRHFAGWYMINMLDLASEDVAIALGHTDGGDLVRKLYGHRDTERALDRVARAFDSTGNVHPLRPVEADSA